MEIKHAGSGKQAEIKTDTESFLYLKVKGNVSACLRMRSILQHTVYPGYSSTGLYLTDYFHCIAATRLVVYAQNT
jgi:hypothetical protein